jgi:hypothetical protein
MLPSLTSINRLALVSFLLAGLTFASFCLGLAPIPLTAWVCYPAALLLGSAALVTGLLALRQVRARGERGRRLALFSVWVGILTFFAVLFFSALTVVLYYYGAEALKSIWFQLKP